MEAGEGLTRPRFSLTDKALFVLLALCIGRLWLMVMPSSLWTDEMATAFVIRYPHDPSFAVAPQVPESLYYWLPGMASKVLGLSEIALRIPSVLATVLTLYIVARLSARLIHAEVKWLAVAICLCLVEFDFVATDARPYAAGVTIGSASLYFLVRWLDEGKWGSVFWFVASGALLWRTHLLYWPFYFVYPFYMLLRLFTGIPKARASQVGAVMLALPAALIPVAIRALEIHTGAHSHAFNAPPGVFEFLGVAEFSQIAIALMVALVFKIVCRWKRETPKAEGASVGLILGWWLICPICLSGYSWITGNGVMIPRYVSLMLPGVALTATLGVTRLVPPRHWKRAAVVAAFVALVALGQWWLFWPIHMDEQWREAAQFERQNAADSTPVLCLSPFIEAQPPAWTPDYRLPGFLYSYLAYYPLRGVPSVFPFKESVESDAVARQLLTSTLIPSGRFVVFGPIKGVEYLHGWLQSQPKLIGWREQVYRFGVVFVVLYSAPAVTPP